jgi:hypothetical protein
MAKIGPKIMFSLDLSLSLSLINMVVLKHKQQVKSMQTHKMLMISINMGITF